MGESETAAGRVHVFHWQDGTLTDVTPDGPDSFAGGVTLDNALNRRGQGYHTDQQRSLSSSTLSTTELTKLSHTLGRALAAADVNQLGRETGQAARLRTVTPHRLFLAMVSTLGSGRVESLADLLRAFNHQNGVEVAYKAFYNRLARIGFATFMRGMLARLLDQLRVQTLMPDGQKAVARFTDIVIHDGSSFARRGASRCAPITSSTPWSPRSSSASVFARRSVGVSPICSRTPDAPRIAIVAPAAYAPACTSRRSLKY